MAVELMATRSRNVNGYVTAELRRRQLAARLEAKERALDSLRVKVRDADTAAKIRYRKLTGGQLAEARRILEGAAAFVPGEGERR